MPNEGEIVKFGVGQPLRRFEDQRLLTGKGRFQDDVVLPRQAHAAFVRSPHAHAAVRSVDTTAAKRAPGVLAVYTGADYQGDGLAWISTDQNPANASPAAMAGSRMDQAAAFRCRYMI
jgi:aerobic carbon-monoxide dehydrogenase large subunit